MPGKATPGLQRSKEIHGVYIYSFVFYFSSHDLQTKAAFLRGSNSLFLFESQDIDRFAQSFSKGEYQGTGCPFAARPSGHTIPRPGFLVPLTQSGIASRNGFTFFYISFVSIAYSCAFSWLVHAKVLKGSGAWKC